MSTARTLARDLALATRLLQVLRRQVTRSVRQGTGGTAYAVYEGAALTTLEARRLEAQGLIRWASPLDGLTIEEVAHLTPAGEQRLHALNGSLPSRVQSPVEHVLSMLGHLALKKEQYAADKMTAIREQRWSLVPGLDGILTGLLMAESVLRDEIRHLNGEQAKAAA